MKKLFINALAFCAVCAPVVLTSCSEENETQNPDEAYYVNEDNQLCIKGEYTWENGKVLEQTVLVENGGVLKFNAGTTVKCGKGFDKYILILQGGKIEAAGTESKPVVFTSAESSPAAGDWGGIIINGRAPLSGGGTYATEINNDYLYGGTDAADNSGRLTYVKIEYAGASSGSDDIEHNGLTLNGVGNGTQIDHIYVLESADDAIEFFGGSVNVTNLLAVNPDDDMFDFTQGYNGELKDCYGIWEDGYTSTESDPRGIEADGNLDGKNPEHTPQSDFKVTNMTIDLRTVIETPGSRAETTTTNKMNDVIKIRRGCTAEIKNALLKGNASYSDLIDLTDDKSNATDNCNISITNSTSGNNVINNDHDENGTVSIENVKIEDGNTGCSSSVFGWTGYEI